MGEGCAGSLDAIPVSPGCGYRRGGRQKPSSSRESKAALEEAVAYVMVNAYSLP